jgi:hypothetical protein
MISIAEMKTLAEKEVKAEKELAEIKYNKDLAMYRDRLKEVKPKLMEYIEKCIYNGIKHNSKIGLYIYYVEDIFKPIRDYGDNILYYLADPNRKTISAYDVALKELADEVREELFKAGVVKITKNIDSCFMGEPYLFLEI